MTARDSTSGMPPGADEVTQNDSDDGSDEPLPDTTDERGIPLDNPSG